MKPKFKPEYALVIAVILITALFFAPFPNPISKLGESDIEYVDVIRYINETIFVNSTDWNNSTIWINSTAWINSTIWINSTENLPYPFVDGWNSTLSENFAKLFKRTSTQTPYRIEYYNQDLLLITSTSYQSWNNLILYMDLQIQNGQMSIQQYDSIFMQYQILLQYQ